MQMPSDHYCSSYARTIVDQQQCHFRTGSTMLQNSILGKRDPLHLGVSRIKTEQKFTEVELKDLATIFTAKPVH